MSTMLRHGHAQGQTRRVSSGTRNLLPANARSFGPRRGSVIVQANAQENSRRDLLLAGTLLAVTSLTSTSEALAEQKYMSVENLGAFQRADQRKQIQTRSEKYLKEALTAADAPSVLRLVFHDAGTYDQETRTGGMNGSIILEGELNRPENAGLKPLVARLAEVKAKIDEESATVGQGPLSWADLLVIAGKVATRKVWYDAKVARAKISSGGNVIATAFAADWPIQLGRIDATEPDPAGRLPALDAPVAEVKAFMAQLGRKPGQGTGAPFAPKAPFWERPTFVLWPAVTSDPSATEVTFATEDPSAFAEWKKKYDASRRTTTRTEYEVDFVTYYTNLTRLGAKFDPDAYLYPEKVNSIKF